MKNITNYFLLIILVISLIILKPTSQSNIFKFNYLLNNIIYLDLENDDEDINDPCRPRNLEQLKGKKLIAFTFDDGPNNKTTLKLLEGLEKYDARVTFFVLGSRVNNNKESLVKAYETCNQIGNHTYNHFNLLKQNTTTITNEINTTNLEVYNIVGEYPTIIRPPYGNTNSNIKNIGNMPTILWNIDTLDWKYRNKDRISNEIIEKAHDGAIVLLHDIYSTSIEGALIAMEELKDEYVFVTIEEMMLLKNIEIDKNKTYYNFK